MSIMQKGVENSVEIVVLVRCGPGRSSKTTSNSRSVAPSACSCSTAAADLKEFCCAGTDCVQLLVGVLKHRLTGVADPFPCCVDGVG